MDYTEKDIERCLVGSGLLSEEYGIEVIASQFRTAYGIIDILGYDPLNKQIVIVELKKGTVDESAVGQIMKYLAAIYDLIDGYQGAEIVPDHIADINKPYGLLIGKKASDGVLATTRIFPFIKFAEVDIEMKIAICMDEYKRSDDSLQADMLYYEKSGVLEKIDQLFQDQLAEEQYFEMKRLEKERAEQVG